MAPPKRKTGGRVTEKGTRPSLTRTSGKSSTTTKSGSTSSATSRRMATGPTAESSHASSSSSRYTPPVPVSVQHSRPWVPFLMLSLMVAGGLMIMLRYLVWTDSNIPTILGLAFILGGLYTATKWR
ncbi:MAG: cell division protein CrgA [Ilumatobacteraceae bacterium]